MIECAVNSKKEFIMQLNLAAQNAVNGESTEIVLNNPTKTRYRILKEGYDPERGVKSIINNMKGMKEEEFEFIKPNRGFFTNLRGKSK